MAGSIPSQLNFGSFVTTTNIWEIQQLQELNIDPKLKELLIRLYQNINTISLSLNTRDAGYYVQQEFLNGQIYFPDSTLNSTTAQAPTMRQVFRTVVDFGALPNAGSKTIPHNIDVQPTFKFTRIYGTASKSDASVNIPIPFSSITAIANNIEIAVSITDVAIFTGIDYSAFTNCFVVLEYIKQ